MSIKKSLAFTLVALTTMLVATEDETVDPSIFLKGELASSCTLKKKKISQSNTVSVETGHKYESTDSCLKLSHDMKSPKLKLSNLKKLYFNAVLYNEYGLESNVKIGLFPFTDSFFFKGSKEPNTFTGLFMKNNFENNYFLVYLKTGLAVPINAKISDFRIRKGFASELGIENICQIPVYLRLTYSKLDKAYHPWQLAIGYKDTVSKIPYDVYVGCIRASDKELKEIFAGLSLGSSKKVHGTLLDLSGKYDYLREKSIKYTAKVEHRIHEHLLMSLSFDKIPDAYQETLTFKTAF